MKTQGRSAAARTGRLGPRESYALHCAPFPTGAIVVSPGHGLPGLDHLRLVLPVGDDAAAAAVTAEVAKLGTVGFPQSVDDYRARFHAVLEPGVQQSVCVAQRTEHNVVTVLLRDWPQELFTELRTRVERIAAEAGGRVEFAGEPFPAMVNSAGLSTAAGQYLSAVPGPGPVRWARRSWPFNCEDFALFLREAPGAMFYLGVADAESGMNGAPHTRDFAADERAIGHGVRAMAGLLTHRLATGAGARGGERADDRL